MMSIQVVLEYLLLMKLIQLKKMVSLSITVFVCLCHQIKQIHFSMDYAGVRRSAQFYQGYTQLDVRQVNLLALTATATLSLRSDVSKNFGNACEIIIAISPYKNNIKYRVLPFQTISETFDLIVEVLDQNFQDALWNVLIFTFILTLCLLN